MGDWISQLRQLHSEYVKSETFLDLNTFSEHQHDATVEILHINSFRLCTSGAYSAQISSLGQSFPKYLTDIYTYRNIIKSEIWDIYSLEYFR